MWCPPAPNRAGLFETPFLSWFRVAAAAISFIIYASAVVVLHQEHDNSLCCERIGLATAVSHVVYGAPLGTVYPEIQKQLLDTQAPVDAALERVTHLAPSPEDQTMPINDGNGVGFILVASWAIRLFGAHLSALPCLMLGLMGISTAVFLWRFNDDRSAVVTVTFLSLTLMLCTPLVSDSRFAGQIAIGGIRYFSLLAIVPAFHLVLEIADGKGPSRKASKLPALLLAVQVVLLTIAILVRGNAAYVIGPIVLIGLVRAWRSRRNRTELRAVWSKASVITLVGGVFVGSVLVALPSPYIQDGRITTVFWHRTVISLGVNPAWPFGNLHEIYDCRDGGIPEGLVVGPLDRNGHCIWWHYVSTHNIAHEAALAEVGGSLYEAALRAAFFDIARRYPREILATFFYYKTAWLLQAMESLVLNPAVPSPILMALVIAGLANFLLFLVIDASPSTGSPIFLRLMGLGTLFGVSSIPPYFTAWATPHTIADLLFYCLFCIGLGIGSSVKPIGAAVRRTSAMLARA